MCSPNAGDKLRSSNQIRLRQLHPFVEPKPLRGGTDQAVTRLLNLP